MSYSRNSFVQQDGSQTHASHWIVNACELRTCGGKSNHDDRDHPNFESQHGTSTNRASSPSNASRLSVRIRTSTNSTLLKHASIASRASSWSSVSIMTRVTDGSLSIEIVRDRCCELRARLRAFEDDGMAGIND